MTTQAIFRKNTPPNNWDLTKEFLGSRDGVFRAQKLASEALSLGAEAASLAGHSLPQWNHAATVFNNGALGVTIPFAVGSTIDVGQDAVKYAKRGKALSWDEGVDFVQKAAVSLEMIAYSAFLFTQRSVCALAGDLFAAVEDGLDVVIEKDYLRGLNGLEEKSSVGKTYISEHKKYRTLKMAKAVMAVAVGILGLLGVFFGSPVVPAIAILALSVGSSALAIFNRWYKENMTYNLVVPYLAFETIEPHVNF